jgi:hypothetical protein
VGQRQLYSKGNNPNKDDFGTGLIKILHSEIQ